jgi:integral membrane sensor domain MASE1
MSFSAFAIQLTKRNPADYFYSAATPRSRGALWPIFAPARIIGFQCSLTRLRDVFRLALTAIVSPTIAASVGVTALSVGGVTARSGTARGWLVWWLGDAMGVLVVAPLLLSRPALFSRSVSYFIWGRKRLRQRAR